MGKFKSWLKKLKKKKNVEIDELEDEVEFMDADEDEDEDGQLPENPEYPEYSEEVEIELSEEEDIETENYDATGEIRLDEIRDEIRDEDSTGTPVTGSIEEYDLNQDLTLKDKVSIFARNLKGRIDRFDIRKFKNFKIGEDGTKLPKSVESGPTLISQLSKKLKLKATPKKLEDLELKVRKYPWNNLHNEVFNPKYRTTYNKAFLLALLILAPYFAGKTLGLLLKGAPDYKNITGVSTFNIDYSKELVSNDVLQVKNAKLFKTEKIEAKTPTQTPVKTGPELCEKATKRSALPIKLVNTIVLQDSVKSIASVQIRNKDLADVREGDKIDNMAKVDKIDRLGIIVKNLQDGTCESIDNGDMAGYKNSPISVMTPAQSKIFKANKKIDGIENDGNSFVIQRSFLKEKMNDVGSVLTQAKGIPINNPDGTLSFKIVEIEPGGIFSYLGIQENDIITQINGQNINDLSEVMELFGKVTALDQLKLTVSRGGETVPLDYKLQ